MSVMLVCLQTSTAIMAYLCLTRNHQLGLSIPSSTLHAFTFGPKSIALLCANKLSHYSLDVDDDAYKECRKLYRELTNIEDDVGDVCGHSLALSKRCNTHLDNVRNSQCIHLHNGWSTREFIIDSRSHGTDQDSGPRNWDELCNGNPWTLVYLRRFRERIFIGIDKRYGPKWGLGKDVLRGPTLGELTNGCVYAEGDDAYQHTVTIVTSDKPRNRSNDEHSALSGPSASYLNKACVGPQGIYISLSLTY